MSLTRLLLQKSFVTINLHLIQSHVIIKPREGCQGRYRWMAEGTVWTKLMCDLGFCSGPRAASRVLTKNNCSTHNEKALRELRHVLCHWSLCSVCSRAYCPRALVRAIERKCESIHCNVGVGVGDGDRGWGLMWQRDLCIRVVWDQMLTYVCTHSVY